MSRSCVVVGSGRAGGSFHAALSEVGWRSVLVARAGDVQVDGDPDLVLLAVPDSVIAAVAHALPATDAVVAHVSGACGLDVLAPHRRVGSIHPLMSLPDALVGGRRLLDACTFAVDGDPLMAEVVGDLGGRAIQVPAASRALYHATASIAANHLTALCAQVESLAAEVGVPVDAYWTLMRTTLDNIVDVGPAAALTGPAARADWDTVRAHLDALPTDDDRRLYSVLCERAARLAGHEVPGDVTGRVDPVPPTGAVPE
ncbi:MAG: Rossmann-like and DUF2520 domain-containing protein [Ilumatobacter sp.]|uniref:Rossmann-like and DUF2520 domain-containing protein n=1 Tax=Ilumatobacter sp. TaxID=1967498 RepID=UPI003299CA7D